MTDIQMITESNRMINAALQCHMDSADAVTIMDMVQTYGELNKLYGEKVGAERTAIVEGMKHFPNSKTYPVKDHTQDAHSQFIVPQSNQ